MKNKLLLSLTLLFAISAIYPMQTAAEIEQKVHNEYLAFWRNFADRPELANNPTRQIILQNLENWHDNSGVQILQSMDIETRRLYENVEREYNLARAQETAYRQAQEHVTREHEARMAEIDRQQERAQRQAEQEKFHDDLAIRRLQRERRWAREEAMMERESQMWNNLGIQILVIGGITITTIVGLIGFVGYKVHQRYKKYKDKKSVSAEAPSDKDVKNKNMVTLK